MQLIKVFLYFNVTTNFKLRARDNALAKRRVALERFLNHGFHGFLAVSVLFCSTVFLFSSHFIYFLVYGAVR